MIAITLHGAEEADRELRSIERQLGDLRPLWEDVGDLAQDWFGEQFDTAGAWAGARWAPLSPGYALRKAREHPGRPLLVADGGLQDAATWRLHRDATRGSLAVEIDDENVERHQRGTRTMPARPIIPDRLPFSALRELENAQDEFVDELLRRAARAA